MFDIKWYEYGEKTIDELDNLAVDRFNIKNIKYPVEFTLQNFYVFPVLDFDKASTTQYYAMCLSKDYVSRITKTLKI